MMVEIFANADSYDFSNLPGHCSQIASCGSHSAGTLIVCGPDACTIEPTKKALRNKQLVNAKPTLIRAQLFPGLRESKKSWVIKRNSDSTPDTG